LFELHFEALAVNVEAVHGLDGDVCRVWVVVRDESFTGRVSKQIDQREANIPKHLDRPDSLSMKTLDEMTLPYAEKSERSS